MRALKKANPDMPWVVVTERVSRVSSRALEYFEVPQQQNSVDCGVYVCMFSKELVGRAFECLEERINHPRYSAAKCRREIRGLMCEAGAGTLLESLALKGADIPPQSDQHGGDESDSEGGVEEIKEPTIQDLAAEQLSHAAQLKGLHEDMESLKDSVYSGEKGLDKVMGMLSSLFTAVQGMAAKTGFKLPTGLVEVLNSDEPTTSTAAAPPPHRTPAASLEAPVNMIAVPHASTTAPSHARPTICATTPCTVQGQGATPGAHKSEAGHSALAAVPSSTTQGQPVSAAGVTTAAGGLAGNGEGAQRASSAQAGAPDVAFPSARRQAGASAGASTQGVGQPGAASGMPGAASSLRGALHAAGSVPTVPTGQTGAAAFIPTASTGHTGAAVIFPTVAAGHAGPATGVPTASAGHATAASGVPTGAAGLGVSAAEVQGAQWSVVAAGTARAPDVQRASSVWSSGEQFFAPSAFHTGAHMQGVRAPSAVGFAQNAGAIQQVATSSAAHSWPIGFAHQPPSAVYPGTVQPSDLLQLPFSTLRPPLHPSAPFLAADEVLDDTNSQPGHTTAPQGRGLSSMLPGLMQGSQHVLPSPAASSSMAPATQGGEIGEVPGKRGWTGVTKKLDKDEWIARIVLDRASQSLIVINSHFGTEEEAARSIAAASHVMFVDKPTRGELILLTAADKAKLSDCSAHQCEVMVRMKFWHMWEEWRKYWPAAKAKWDEKTRRDEKKRAAINASLEEADARADKIARMRAGGNSGHAYASHEEGSGSKDG
ncbi:unnamed protein product [Closterium sp. NIES-65]|nr:unnamed protein product [Closterium sp. NIES-65]